MSIVLILALIALLLFVAAAAGVGGQVNLVALGLAILTLAWIVSIQ